MRNNSGWLCRCLKANRQIVVDGLITININGSHLSRYKCLRFCGNEHWIWYLIGCQPWISLSYVAAYISKNYVLKLSKMNWYKFYTIKFYESLNDFQRKELLDSSNLENAFYDDSWFPKDNYVKFMKSMIRASQKRERMKCIGLIL